MSSPESGRLDVAAYPCFLLSLLLPGLGQMAAGAPLRGLAMAAVAVGSLAVFLTGTLEPPWTGGADARSAGLLAVLVVLWLFAPHDAWFRVRERRNGMVPCLPRTPRVAFLADALWGGLGRVYLDGVRALPWALPAAAGMVVLALFANPGILVAVFVWNVTLGAVSWNRAVARHHAAPEYAACQAALDAAPFASRRAPSPSLPFATMVAVFIAAMGALFVIRTLEDLRAVPPTPVPGEVIDNRFVSADREVEMALPADWQLRPGVPPVLLEARRAAPAMTFSLARARAMLFRENDLVPFGALTRFAGRQEAELAGSLPGFRLLSRAPLESEPPGIRLVFASSEGGDDRINVQEYLLAGDRVLVLTLSGAADLGELVMGDAMDTLGSTVRIRRSVR